MTNSYVLVNPYILGEFKTKIKANNSNEAAKIFYTNLSEHFNNAVPEFNFSIQKGGSGEGKYYNFKVNEIRKKDDVTFSIKSININEETIENFQEKLNEFKNNISQTAGKKSSKKHKKNKKHKKYDSSEDSDSSDSSDSSDYYKKINTYIPTYSTPIYYWYYNPSLYNLSSYYYVPTFTYTLSPIIQIVG